MTQEQWTAFDNYLSGLFAAPDPLLEAVQAAAEAAGLPPAQVSPHQGRLLAILAQVVSARAILEIGTLGGYSTIWLARSLPPGGRMVTLEFNPKHAEVARANLAMAGLSTVVDLRIGPALDSLPVLAEEGQGPFDLIFIDADKPNYAAYLDWSIRLARPGGLIVADNVVRGGAVADPNSPDPAVQGARQFNAALAADPRVSSVVVQTVGSKGYDGFAIAVVR